MAARSATSASSRVEHSSPLTPKPPSGPSINRYIHRIGIEGIDNYLRATGKFEKHFWSLVILAGVAGTLVYLIPAFTQYLEYTTVLDIQYRTSPELRPPNTWICRWAVNYSYFYHRFDRIKARMRQDKRMQLFARRYTSIWKNVNHFLGKPNTDTILDIMLNYITMPPSLDGSWTSGTNTHMFNEVIHRAIEAFGSEWSGFRTFYEEGFFDCPSVLKNCSLNGFPIDCCRDSVLGYNNEVNKCFMIDVSRELLNNPNLVKRGHPIELSVEAIVDSRYFLWNDGAASGIVLSFQTGQPTLFDQVYNLAAGAVSRVNVRGTQKHRLADCIDRYQFHSKFHVNSDPTVQEYFKSMQNPDSYSLEKCSEGRLIEAMSIRCGCVPYIDTMRPNESIICTPAHIYACLYTAFQGTLETEAVTEKKERNSATASGVQQKDIFVDLKGLIASDCAALCDSWFYDADVFSTIMDGDEGDITDYWRNKVTIVFDPEYRVETEVLKIDRLAFLASIGDALGLMLGMSIITFVQVVVWPVAALRFRRKLRRVAPMMEDDHQTTSV